MNAREPDVPEEAVEAAERFVATSPRKAVYEMAYDIAAGCVRAAAPAIREQERQRAREALSEPIHVLASTIGRARVLAEGRPGLEKEIADAADAMGRLRVALDSLEDPV